MEPTTTTDAKQKAKSLFALGQIVATPGALEALRNSNECHSEFLCRHVRGDWGEVGEDDAKANNVACAHEGNEEQQGRLLSAYKTKLGERLWVITEWDRSATTVLLPDEY